MSTPNKEKTNEEKTDELPLDFVRTIIKNDLATNKNEGKLFTRFPPEPNGNLHIGHVKSICLNFGVADEYGGKCYLRFDDTNPLKESTEYMEGIKEAIQWLGYDWEDRLRHSSDYFDQLYAYALDLINAGKAYVCSLSPDEIREYRGTLKEKGKNSPYRDRSIEENLDLFTRMKDGEFDDGTHVLRVKIDMQSPNINLRDPIIYRIRKVAHHRTGDKWCIYPMYDYTHCISDAIEGITHSLCTIEFEDHRPLYDWVLDQLDVPCHPQQIEFSRLALNYTVMSKRKLAELVDNEQVSGWDDPRMPTLVAVRRRGCPPAAIRDFAKRVGVTKKVNISEIGLLENCIRENLSETAPRVMAVLDPLKVVIDNFPEGEMDEVEAPFHPNNEALGKRKIPFSKVLYIEKDDFREVPPRKYKRLTPGVEVRLRYGYIIKCESVVKDEETGEILEIHCTYDPASKSGSGTPESNRKVKGVIHWVSAEHSVKAEVRMYDRLFNVPNPTGDKEVDFKEHLNPNSIEILDNCQIERSLAGTAPESRFQFERQGYFCTDIADSTGDKLVFNRTVTLRDSWGKIEKENKQAAEVKK